MTNLTDDDFTFGASQLRQRDERAARRPYVDPLAPDPEEEAGIRRTAEQAGITPAEARAEPNLAAREAQAAQAAQVLLTAPRTRDWLGQPGNGEVARDDVQALSTIEQVGANEQAVLDWDRNVQEQWRANPALRHFRGLLAIPRGLGRVGAQLMDDTVVPYYDAGQREQELFGLERRLQQQPELGLSDQEEMRLSDLREMGQPEGGIPIAREAVRMIPLLEGTLTRAWDELTGAQAPAGAYYQTPAGRLAIAAGRADPRDLAQGRIAEFAFDYGGEVARDIYQVGGAVPGSGLLTYIWDMEAAGVYASLRDQGVDHDVASDAAEQAGALNTAVEIFGAGLIMGRAGIGELADDVAGLGVRQAIRNVTQRAALSRAGVRVAEAGVIGASEEGIQETFSMMTETAARRRDGVAAPENLGIAERYLESIRAGMEGGVGLGAPVISANLGLDMRAARRAEQNREVFEQLGQGFQNSLLRQRLPSAMRGAVDAIVQGTPVETMRIDADAFVEVFHGAGIRPEEAAAQIGVSREALTQALAAGGDIEISMGRFAEHIAGSPHYNALIKHARLRAQDFTQAELETANRVEAAMQQVVEDSVAQTEAMSSLSDTIETRLSELFAQAEREGGPVGAVTRRYARLVSAMPQAMMGRIRQAVARGEATQEYADGVEQYFRDFFESRLDIQGPERANAETGREQFEQRGKGPDAGPSRSETWTPPEGVKISERARKIAEMAINGASNEWIAEEMDVAPTNVAVTLNQVKTKLGGSAPWEASSPGSAAGVNPRTGQPTATIQQLVKARQQLMRGDYPHSSINKILAERFGVSPATVKVRLWQHDRAGAGGQELYSFGGERSANVDTDALARAEEMEALGHTPAEIWNETGWWRNPIDRKWRYEIDDTRAAFITVPVPRVPLRGKLVDILRFPELFMAYPSLKDVAVEINIGGNNGREAYYDEESGAIVIETMDAPDAFSILLHEVQHAIQAIEGFAKGGNTDMAQDYVFEFLEAKEEARQAIVNDRRFGGDRAKYEALEIQHPQIFMDLEKSIEERAATRIYLRFAGEMEARAVQRRRGDAEDGAPMATRLNSEQRRRTDPSQGYDLALDQAIIPFEDGLNYVAIRSVSERVDDIGSVLGEPPAGTARAEVEGDGVSETGGRGADSARGARPAQTRAHVSPTGRRDLEEILAALDVAEVESAPIIEDAQAEGYQGNIPAEAAEWNRAAAKGLPMDEASRMERARQMGFNVERIFYHGTNRDIQGGFRRSGSGALGPGVYMATKPETTDVFAGTPRGVDRDGVRTIEFGTGSNVLPLLVRGDRFATLNQLDARTAQAEQAMGRYSSRADAQWQAADELSREGFVGAFDGERDFYVVFDAANVRSRHAAFDPDYGASPNLLAATDASGRPIGGMSPQFDPDGALREAVIRLYAYRDGRAYTLSTFLHETGHLFLELMRTVASDPAAPVGVQAIWTDTLDWFGLTPEQWDSFDLEGKRAYHERWAEAFEAYLMEGRAPSAGLREAFQAFKAWLTRIYNEMFARQRLDPQIRDIFNRLLATDQEIAEARAEMGADFTLGREAFRSEEDYAAYQQSIQDAFRAAEDEIRAQAMDVHVRRGKRRWRQLASQERAAATRAVDSDPARRAHDWLAFNEWRDLPQTNLSEEGEISYIDPVDALIDKPEGLPSMRLDVRLLEPQDLEGLPAAVKPMLGDGALQQVLARLDALPDDVPRNPVDRSKVRAAYPKADDANAVSARPATEDGEIVTSWATLQYRAGRDMIVGEAQNDARPVRRDIFEMTYAERAPGQWVKRADVPVGYFVADRDQTIQTFEGPVEAKKGDHILIGAIGEMWPVRADKFAQRYNVAPSPLEVALAEAMRLKREGKEKRPTRLARFVKDLGGIKDTGGEIKQALGSGRAYPGLINNTSGMDADDLALRVWEAGYFGVVPRKGELFAEAPDAGGSGARLASPEARAALEQYLFDGNMDFQAGLRGLALSRSGNPPWPRERARRHADLLTEAMAEHPPAQGRIVRYERAYDGQPSYQPGQPITMDGMTSFTPAADREMLDFWSAGSNREFIVEAPTLARHVRGPKMDEVLYPAGTEFVVDRVVGRRVFLREANPAAAPDGGAASAGRAADAPNDGASHPGFEFFSEGPRRPTMQEFLDLLIADLRNERQVYSIRDEDAVAAYQNRSDALRWFESRGIDLSGKKDEIAAQIADALAREAEGGVDPDIAAEWFGFSSGDELIQALKGLKPRAQAIEEEVSRRVEAEYGDPVRDGTLEEEARRAAHNEAQARRIEIELMAIQRATGKRVTPVGRAARAWAERAVNNMSVKEVRGFDKFLAAERRSARNAMEAMGKGDALTAETWKQRQLTSFWLWKIARAAADEMDRAQRYFKKFESGGVRAAFLPDGARHLDQIDQVLESIDLRVNPYPSQRQRQSFEAYMASLEEQGIDASDIVEAAPDFLAAIKRRPFASLSIEEARGVRAVVENFENLGRRWNRMWTDRKNRQMNEVIDGMQEHAAREYPKRAAVIPSIASRSRFQQAADLVMDLHGSMVKMEQLTRAMDGLKANGPWFNAFIPAAQRAESAKLERLIQETERFKQLLSVYSRRDLGKMLIKREFIPAIGDNLTRMQQIGVLLYSGTEYRRNGLMKGFAWNEQQLQAVIDNLDERDVRFAQGVWDLLESFQAESFDLDYRVRGVRPEADPGVPVRTRFGVIQGKYFPIKFDPDHPNNNRAAKRQAKEAVEQLSGGSYRQIGTKRGRLKQLVGTAGMAFRLDPITIIGEHIEETVHDLTHRELVIDARRLIASRRVRDSVRGVLGPWAVKVMDAWVAKVEQPQPIVRSSWERLAGRIKNNATIVNMGLKVTTALIQELGVMNAIPRAGIIPTLKQKGITIARDYPTFLAQQTARLFGAPETLPARVQFVFDRSPMMKRRMGNFDRDVKDARDRQLGARPGILPEVPKDVQDKMMILSQLMDMGVSIPAWLAGYETALGGKVEGITQGDEQAAIEHADSIIRTTQSGGMPKDLASILANDNQFWRLATMFMSWANTFYNQMFVEQIPGVLAGKISPPRFAANMLFIWFIPALVTMWFYGRLEPQDGEDEEEFLKRAALEGLVYPLQTVPIMRDGINAYVTGYDYQFTPAQAAMEAPIRLAKAAERGDTEEVVKQALMSAGYVSGLPSRQMWITGEGLTDIATGEDDLDDPADTLREVLVRDTR